MTSMLRLEVRKDDLTQTRLQRQDLPALNEGEVLCQVDRFALTANNVTYGVVGERIGYWKFFPADEGWGVIPVWGFADVIESQHPDIPVGERLYGYWPMGTHVVLKPEAVKPERLVDGSAHRAALPPVYNSYSRTAGEPHFEAEMENERMLLMPLYATSWCLYDFLRDNVYFGASRVLIISASSKTALGLAMALAEDESSPACTALTSARNFAWVSGLGLYQDVLAYDDVDQLDASIPTVIVDMSGNGALLARL
ncbi:MAG TPA: DUF2855 family protein, partial [Xanthomonadales bacterium]|nr:DUF2855 family protein [Xanthomonadales bacterium]